MENQLDKLIGIFFRKCYFGFGVVTDEEEKFLKDNEFVCIVTEETKNNGYDSQKEFIRENLEINKEYTFVSMDVGQSSSSMELSEFPGKFFNPVCFEIRIK